MSVFTDLDLRNHVPNELEVDLCDNHPVFAPQASHRQSHVRLGLSPEIDRTEIDLAFQRAEKRRILGEIFLTADDVHGDTRDANLFTTCGIELGQFGNRRHLTHHARGIKAPFLNYARAEWKLYRPTKMTLDLLNELYEPAGCRLGLHALNPDKEGVLSRKRKPSVGKAAGDQTHTNARHKQRNVLSKQPAT